MDFYLNSILSLSIAIPAATGWIRFKKMDPAFLPFNILMWFGLYNETISISLNLAEIQNIGPHNLFNLVESILLTWQFKRWGMFQANKWFWMVLFLFIISWSADYFLVSTFSHFNTFFHLEQVFILSLMAIHVLTKVAFSYPGPLLKDSRFLICILLLLFFTITLLVQGYLALGEEGSRTFRINTYAIFAYTNCIINFLFTLAIIWIPRKRNFISLF